MLSAILQKELQNVDSFQYGKNEIMYTDLPSDFDLLTPYRNNIIDFTGSKLDTYAIEISKQLTSDDVKGSLFAKRCNFNSENGSIVYCLVKKNSKQDSIVQEPDAIVKIDWRANKASYILKNATFSASNIYPASEKEIYFVGQENKQIYKIN